METALTALIVISVMVLAIVGLSDRSMSAQSAISEASRTMQERVTRRSQTSLTAVSAAVTPQGDYVQVALKNTGTVKLSDWNQWDVIVNYFDGTTNQVHWYAYGNAANQWTTQLYQTTTPPTAETVEPGILDPGEELVVTVNLIPPVATGTTNVISVSTPNGVTTPILFSH